MDTIWLSTDYKLIDLVFESTSTGVMSKPVHVTGISHSIPGCMLPITAIRS